MRQCVATCAKYKVDGIGVETLFALSLIIRVIPDVTPKQRSPSLHLIDQRIFNYDNTATIEIYLGKKTERLGDLHGRVLS